MHFDFTEEQKLFRDASRKFLEAECPPTFVRRMMDDEKAFDPAFVLVGGVIGAKWGGRAGVAKGSFELEAGLAFNEYVAMKDEQGNLMNPDIAAAGAVTVGAVNAGLEFASFWALGRTITPAMRLVLRNKVKQILLTQTRRRGEVFRRQQLVAQLIGDGVNFRLCDEL